MCLDAMLIFAVSFIPPLLSVLLMGKLEEQARARLRSAIDAAAESRFPVRPQSTEAEYIQGVGYILGDITCHFNAHSGYIRCAVNPVGPCEGCRYYQPKDLDVDSYITSGTL